MITLHLFLPARHYLIMEMISTLQLLLFPQAPPGYASPCHASSAAVALKSAAISLTPEHAASLAPHFTRRIFYQPASLYASRAYSVVLAINSLAPFQASSWRCWRRLINFARIDAFLPDTSGAISLRRILMDSDYSLTVMLLDHSADDRRQALG
jgi:hypothetical protein